jgi:predicted extracellular nuclease
MKNVKLVVLGDFNAFEFTDGYVDVAGIITGDFDPTESLVCSIASCPDIVTQDLTNEVLNIDPADRYSFIFRDSFNAAGSRGDAQVLDHAMTSKKLSKFVTDLQYARGNADAAEELVEDDGTLDDLALRASDHDGLVLYICKDDDVCNDD